MTLLRRLFGQYVVLRMAALSSRRKPTEVAQPYDSTRATTRVVPDSILCAEAEFGAHLQDGRIFGQHIAA
jgi:hypothetical protein